MIDDQIDRTKRVDFLRITPEGFDCISHRGKVHNGRDPSKILKRRKYIYKYYFYAWRYRSRSRLRLNKIIDVSKQSIPNLEHILTCRYWEKHYGINVSRPRREEKHWQLIPIFFLDILSVRCRSRFVSTVDLHFYLFHNGQIYNICLLSDNNFWLQSKVLLKMMLDQLELLMFYLEQNPWREEGDFDSMFRWLVDLPVQDVLNIGSSNLIRKCGRTISKFNLSIPWTFNMIFKENSITRIHCNIKFSFAGVYVPVVFLLFILQVFSFSAM